MSGSGPDQPNDRSEGTPPLLRRASYPSDDGNFLEPNPDHPDYPQDWFDEEEREFRESLDGDEEFQARLALAVVQLHDRLGRPEQIRARLGDLFLVAANWRHTTGDVSRVNDFSRIMGAISHHLHDATGTLGRHDVPFPLRLRYLAERTLTVDLVHLVAPYETSAVTMLVNADPSASALVAVQPGETVIKFSRISVRDIQKHLGRFITAGQKETDHVENRRRGGNPRLEDNPRTRSRAVQAAKLWHIGGHRNAAVIAQQVGLVENDERPSDDRVRLRVNRYVEAGTRYLRRTDPQWPESRRVGDNSNSSDLGGRVGDNGIRRD